MKKVLLLFIFNTLIAIVLLGCSISNNIACNIEEEGFEIIQDSTMLAQDIQDWIQLNENSTGVYKSQFEAGNFLLISLGSHKKYKVKKINIEKNDYGYVFSVTVVEPESDTPKPESSIAPILIKTEHSNASYDIKIIYK